MKITRTALLVVFCLSLLSKVWAASGTEGAAFLDIPVGAGPAALGSAYSALATDAYAPVYNPAGLGFLSSTQVAAQHLAYLDSIHYEYLSFVHPFAKNTKGFGVSAQYFGSGDIAGTDLQGNSIGDYSNNYGAYSVVYGQKVTDRLSLGLTGKWVHAKLADTSADAFAADLGSLYQLDSQFQFALTVNNLGSKLTFIDQADSLPGAVHLGAVYLPSPNWKMTGEGIYSFSRMLSGRLGLEWNPVAFFSLRAGYKTETTQELSPLAGLTAGMGLTVWGHELAYAWLPYGELGNTQYVSLLLRFGAMEERRRNLIQYTPIKSHRGVHRDPSHPSQSDFDAPEYQMLMEMLSDEKERNTRKSSDDPASRKY